MPPEQRRKAGIAQRILYSRDEYLLHFIWCPEAKKIFTENYETKIAGGIHLHPCSHKISPLAGNLADLEPCKTWCHRLHQEYYKTPPFERGKEIIDLIKKTRRTRKRKTSDAGEQPTAGEMAASGEPLNA
jgi:hypothetical protein